jgi:hypothetical protein
MNVELQFVSKHVLYFFSLPTHTCVDVRFLTCLFLNKK